MFGFVVIYIIWCLTFQVQIWQPIELLGDLLTKRLVDSSAEVALGWSLRLVSRLPVLSCWPRISKMVMQIAPLHPHHTHSQMPSIILREFNEPLIIFQKIVWLNDNFLGKTTFIYLFFRKLKSIYWRFFQQVFCPIKETAVFVENKACRVYNGVSQFLFHSS